MSPAQPGVAALRTHKHAWHNPAIHACTPSPSELCAHLAGKGEQQHPGTNPVCSPSSRLAAWAFCSIPPSPVNSLHNLKLWTHSAFCFNTLCCPSSTKGLRRHIAWRMQFSPLLCTFPTPAYDKSLIKVSLSISLKIIIIKKE